MNFIRITNGIKQYYKRNTLITKIILSYFIIVVVLLSIFSYATFHTYSIKNIEDVNRTSENSIYQSYYIANVLLTNNYNNFYQIFYNGMDKDISDCLNEKNVDLLTSIYALNKLDQYELANPLIRSIYLYNPKAGRVMFSVNQEGHGINSTGDFFDKDIIKRLNIIEKNSIYFTRKVSYVLKENEVKENLLTLIFANFSGNRKIESALVINLNQEVFQKMVTSGKTGDPSQVLVMYKNGDVLSYSDSSIIDKNLSKESYAKKIIESPNDEGNFVTEINGVMSSVCYVKAQNWGLIFVGIGEYNKLILSMYPIQKTLFILTFIFIFVGLLVAAFFTSSIYNPFKKLIHEIQLRGGDYEKNVSLDVFDYLKSTFHELADDIDKYKLDSSQLLDNKKKVYLEKLVEGDIDQQMLDTKFMMECGIQFETDFFIVAVLKINTSESQISDISSKDITPAKSEVLKVAGELFSRDQFKVEIIDNGNDYISVIFVLESLDEGAEERVIAHLNDLQESLYQQYKISMTIGIGDKVERITYISKSFHNAMTALSYKMIFGRKSLIKYGDIADRDSNGLHEYPHDVEKQIIKSLKELNLKKIDANLSDFFTELALYSVDKIQIAVVQLAVSLTKTLSSLYGNNSESKKYGINEIYAEIQMCETLEEIRQYLYSLCLNVVMANDDEPKKSNRLENVCKIQDYVKKHYKDINISTDLVADYVGLSRNYVRAIYKEATGVSLSDYITECRMVEAQKLLTQTDYPVGKIAETVGYPENYKHFYTIFKKYFGSTPDNYRNEKKLI